MSTEAPRARGRIERIEVFGVVKRAGRPDESIVFGDYQAGFFGWLRRKLQTLLKGSSK